MKLRNTLILFGIALLLFAFVYAYEIRKPKEDTDKSLGRVLQMREGDVTKIKVAYSEPNSPVVICSKDSKGEWRVEQPPDMKVDQKTIQNLISGTTSKYIYNTIKEPGDLSEYGLDNPRVTAMFYLKDGTHRKIMIGDEVPIGNYVYLKDEFTPDIYMVPEIVADNFIKLKESQASKKG